MFFSLPRTTVWSALRQFSQNFISNIAQISFPNGNATIVRARAQMNACPLFYTTSSCSGRITLFLDRRAPGGTGTQSKGGEWLLITHGTVEWADLHRALYETFPARLRKDRAIANTSDADGNSNQSEPEAKAEPEAMAKAEPETEAGALTLRFEPFILAVECASIDAASRMLRVAANAGFRCALFRIEFCGFRTESAKYMQSKNVSLNIRKSCICNSKNKCVSK